MPSRFATCNASFLGTFAKGVQDENLIERLLRVSLRKVEGIGAH